MDSENGNPSPNSSQLYKQVSKTSQPEDRTSNGSDLGSEEPDGEVVLRRDLVKQVSRGEEDELEWLVDSFVFHLSQESKLNLLEETDVQKYLVLKKEGEEGPEIKGGPMDALIIHATKVEKISENGEFRTMNNER